MARIDLPSGAWIEVKDNLKAGERYAVRDAPDVTNEGGVVTVRNATANVWKTFLTAAITAWSYEGVPIPSLGGSVVLDDYPDTEEDQDYLDEQLRDRVQRAAGNVPNQRKPPQAPSGASSSS